MESDCLPCFIKTPLWPCASIYDLHQSAGGLSLHVCAAPNVRRLSKQGREVCNTTRKSSIPYNKMWVQQDTLRTKQAVRSILVIFLVELLHN